MLTQSQLKEVLNYNSDTGIFVWRRTVSPKGVKGNIAGTINGRGYRHLGYKGRIYRLHRLAFLYVKGHFPKDQVDHINQNKLDNRWINLREVTSQENNRNLPLSSRNKSGVVGVFWDKSCSKWKAVIWNQGKAVNLGHFFDKFEGICARMSAHNKYGYHENHGRTKP